MNAILLLMIDNRLKSNIIQSLSSFRSINKVHKIRGEFDLALSVSSSNISGLQKTIKENIAGVRVVTAVMPELEGKQKVYAMR